MVAFLFLFCLDSRRLYPFLSIPISVYFTVLQSIYQFILQYYNLSVYNLLQSTSCFRLCFLHMHCGKRVKPQVKCSHQSPLSSPSSGDIRSSAQIIFHDYLFAEGLFTVLSLVVTVNFLQICCI